MKTPDTITISRDRYDALLQDNLLQSERIAELEAVLQPFADEAKVVEAEFGPCPDTMITATLPYGMLRSARMILEETGDGDS